MAKNPFDDLSAPPGTFADTLAKGQGGSLFGMPGPDTLPTHPQSRKQPTPGGKISLRARYKQFDLTKDDQVEELERIMTDILNGKRYLRQERMANDKDGFTIVTLSWADVEESAPASASPPKDDKSPKMAVQFPFPTIPDGAYPGSGVTLRPPGFSPTVDGAERAWVDRARDQGE
jgi:hypothetical protein